MIWDGINTAQSQNNQIIGSTSPYLNQVTRYYVSSEITQNKCKVNWTVSGGQITGSTTGYEVFVTWQYGGACSISLDTWGCTNPVLCCAVVDIYPQNPPLPPVTISGRITNQNGQAAIGISVSNGITIVTTNSNGNYSFTVPYNWTGTVTPLASNCASFSPISRNFSNITTNQIQNFSGTITPTEFELGFTPNSYSFYVSCPSGGAPAYYGYWYYVVFNDGTTLSRGGFLSNIGELYNFNKSIRSVCIQSMVFECEKVCK
jgi:hypothetical protein